MPANKCVTAPDTDLHLIECAGRLGGVRCVWFVERDRNEMDFKTTVADIISGQVDDVRHVWRANPAAKSFTDASEEIAREICNRVVDGGPMPTGGLYDFLEDKLGCRAMADLAREMEAA